MDRLVFDFLDRMRQGANDNDLRACFSRVASDLGVVCYGIVGASEGRRTVTAFEDHFAPGWVEHYNNMQVADECPYARSFRTATTPYLWSDIVIDPANDSVGSRVTEEARSFGIRAGIFVPIITPDRGRGVVALHTETNAIYGRRRVVLVGAATAFYSSFVGRQSEAAEPEERLLSAREAEILTLLASGRSAEKVADCLHISVSTVRFHLRNAALKLGSGNVTHTIVQAFRRGEIAI